MQFSLSTLPTLAQLLPSSNCLIKRAAPDDGTLAGDTLRMGIIHPSSMGDNVGRSLGRSLADVLDIAGLKERPSNPYKDVIEHMLREELADKYDREASNIRRSLRIADRQKERDKETRKRVSESRFF